MSECQVQCRHWVVLYTLHAQTDWEEVATHIPRPSRLPLTAHYQGSWMLILFLNLSPFYFECLKTLTNKEKTMGRPRNKASWTLSFIGHLSLQWELVLLTADWPQLTCSRLLLSENTLHQQDEPFMEPGEKRRVVLSTRTRVLMRAYCSLCHHRCVPSLTWCETLKNYMFARTKLTICGKEK